LSARHHGQPKQVVLLATVSLSKGNMKKSNAKKREKGKKRTHQATSSFLTQHT
jgi:hypothetical protein